VESAPKKRGNPYRDANGRLTSKDKAVIDIREQRINTKHDNKGRFAKHASTATHLNSEHDKTVEFSQKMLDTSAPTKLYPSHDSGDPIDRQLAALAGERGFNAKPTKGDIDKTIADGGLEIHRGIVSSQTHTSESIEKGFKDGEYEPGMGNYGNGFYFSTSKGIAQMYADAPIARDGYNAKSRPGGRLMRAALHKDAKVVEYEDLLAEREEWWKQHKSNVDWDIFSKNFKADPGKIHPAFTDATRNPGAFATLMGYDAIRVRLKSRRTDRANAARIKRRIGSDDLGDEIVVLNRGMVVVE
jgi:hypothetical protein